MMETVFLNELEKEYSELIETGKIQFIEDVKKLTAKEFSYNYPLYFLGNIHSKLALITFSSNKECLCKENKPFEFNSYRIKSQEHNYDFIDSENITELESVYSSELRILNYLKPFQVIRFDNNSIQKNLQNLANKKLELHLVPFLSPDFSEKDFLNNYKVCKPFIERVMRGILAYPRQYVIFIGDCFNKILAEYIEESETFRFLLTSSDQPNQKFIAQFTRVTLKFRNTRVIAGIAESYCHENLDNIMLEKYGRESVAILNRGLILSNPPWKLA
jgi:hypothetical protein